MLAQRYRIAGRLGKGGMGEVYRAADLLLGQTVALKFLPEELAASESMLERFRNEVRLARQVSHPNVCRVYDLGEADGHLFLTMEFIDGEDLASLLRRIGQVPSVKALEIARKLCLGLAAAHEKGVVHRDLKPANIMLDSRGQVLIADFGLAAAAGEISEGDIRSGTPAYMAPEQLAGREVTARSDLYALGLVLYEVFSGRAPFQAGTRDALMAQQQLGAPSLPGVDAAVARAIERCLEADPALRPPSALAVAGALPGGDPLAAALAAGETPTPEVVAAAGETEAMNPKLAAAAFAALLVGLVALVWICGRGWAFAPAVAEIPPEAMAQKARDAMAHIGYPEKAVAAEWGYSADGARLESLGNVPIVEARRRIAEGRPPFFYFWYRTGSSRLIASSGSPHASQNDPPLSTPGTAAIRLDPQGRLYELRAVPAAQGVEGGAYDWKRLFDVAGLDAGKFDLAPSGLTPPQVFDERRAWVERSGDSKLHVEAAAWQGRPVWFAISRGDPAPKAVLADQEGAAAVAAFTFTVLGIAILGWRNLRLGRGDRRGALRIAAAAALLSAAGTLVRSHGFDRWEGAQLAGDAARAVFAGAVLAAAYVAFEPFVRRRWPDVLISWTRALSGRWRDPLVGRHVLLGLVSGVWLMALMKAADWANGPSALGARSPDLYGVSTAARIAAQIGISAQQALNYSCGLQFVLFLAAVLLRRRWLAIAVPTILMTTLDVLGATHPVLIAAVGIAGYGSVFALLFRSYGFLGMAAAIFVAMMSLHFPFTLDSEAWYFGASLAGMAAIAAAGWWAWRQAIRNRS